MVILFFWELCNTFTQSFLPRICLFAAKVFARDRQTVIFCFIKNINGIKKHERILKELKWVLTVSNILDFLHLAEFCVAFYEKNQENPPARPRKIKMGGRK
jgi:hypothetical protein